MPRTYELMNSKMEWQVEEKNSSGSSVLMLVSFCASSLVLWTSPSAVWPTHHQFGLVNLFLVNVPVEPCRRTQKCSCSDNKVHPFAWSVFFSLFLLHPLSLHPIAALYKIKDDSIFSTSSSVTFTGIWEFRRWGGGSAAIALKSC